MDTSGGGFCRAVFDAFPLPTLLLDADLVITDANAGYTQMVARELADLVGRHVFDAFPDTEGQADAGPLAVSMRTALRTGVPDRLPALEYAMEAESGSGEFEERWWSVVNVPVFDERGQPVGLLNAAEDVTQVVREQGRSRLAQAMAEDSRRRSEQLAGDLQARYQDLTLVRRAEARTSRRLAALADVALELALAETVEQLTHIVVTRGLVALGADGGAVGVPDETGTRLRLSMTDSLGTDTRLVFGELPLDGPLPATVVMRTGQPVLLGDRRAGLAFSPEMAEVYATAGKEAWAALPLRVGGRVLGSITISWDTPQDFAAGDIALLNAFAAQCAQTLDRLLRRQAERASAAATRAMSEALQRSLLSKPVQADDLQIAVRYVPAAHEMQVGGDWYDAFFVADGSTQLVVGDVSGHDRDAAAAMAQVRNVLRCIAHTRVAPPAAVLAALDQAMADLAVGVLTTAIIAKVEQTGDDAARGPRTLRWSNAGHPPPVLIDPDGGARLLTRPVDRLLGVHPGTVRCDHTETLVPGATVVFYTDGLVERRGVPLDEGFEWLRSAAEALAERGLPLEELCDGLLEELGAELEDDVALLAVRAHPGRSRSAAAGPADADRPWRQAPDTDVTTVASPVTITRPRVSSRNGPMGSREP